MSGGGGREVTQGVGEQKKESRVWQEKGKNPRRMVNKRKTSCCDGVQKKSDTIGFCLVLSTPVSPNVLPHTVGVHTYIHWGHPLLRIYHWWIYVLSIYSHTRLELP